MTTDKNTSILQSQGEDIVLNRMYTGSYLSSNLGHEVINMFQADNGKHYKYEKIVDFIHQDLRLAELCRFHHM